MESEAIQGTDTLYTRVAEWLVSRIDQHTFQIGEKIPSIRSLSATLNVSVNTVRQAYDLLERRGYVECRPKSGFLVRRSPPPEPGPSPAASRLIPAEMPFCRIYAEIRERSAAPEAAAMGLALTSPDLLPGKRLGAIMAELQAGRCRRRGIAGVLQLLRGSPGARAEVTRDTFRCPRRTQHRRPEIRHLAPGSRPAACKAFDRSGNVLYCSSFTKTLGAGLRLGWISAGRFVERVQRLKPAVNLAGASVTQAAAARFLEEGSYTRHMRRFRSVVAARANNMRDLVAETFPAGTRISRAPGGILVWVELPAGSDADALFAAALKEDILFAPGSIFSANGEYRNFLRLNGSLAGPLAENAVRRIGELAAAL